MQDSQIAICILIYWSDSETLLEDTDELVLLLICSDLLI